MNSISLVSDLREAIKHVRVSRKSIGFVPTMGYLHDGHRSLIDQARKECDVVVVSIFVNPTQFGPGEDLDRYPRDLEADTQLCQEAGVDIIFNPNVAEMYPEHASDSLVITYPELSQKLCGVFRPGHFDGVMTIMSKLLTLVGPDRCYMGKKDAQQLLLLTRLAKDLFLNVSIIGCPVIRESDGLAMSSRNAYLSDKERAQALAIYHTLDVVAHEFESHSDIESALSHATQSLSNAGLVVQYCDFVDRETLSSVRELKEGQFLLCIAVMCGKTRLIDNFFVDLTDKTDVHFDRGIIRDTLSTPRGHSATEATHV